MDRRLLDDFADLAPVLQQRNLDHSIVGNPRVPPHNPVVRPCVQVLSAIGVDDGDGRDRFPKDWPYLGSGWRSPEEHRKNDGCE